jgi:uncharacterized protein YaaW (UPF0174 family)
MAEFLDKKELFKEVRVAFRNNDFRKLKKLYDELLNEIMLNPDELLIRFCIYLYTLSKITTKLRYQKEQAIKKLEIISELLLEVEKNGLSKNVLDRMEDAIKNIEIEDKRFVIDMIMKARVKTAAILYAKGLSLSKASSLTGIIKEEILSYAGKTMMFERVKEEVDVKKRLETAKEILD